MIFGALFCCGFLVLALWGLVQGGRLGHTQWEFDCICATHFCVLFILNVDRLVVWAVYLMVLGFEVLGFGFVMGD